MAPIAVRVSLPGHLRRLAGIAEREVVVDVPSTGDRPITLGMLLDAVERTYPALRGTLRDYPQTGSTAPGALRPFIRFFAVEQDLTPAGQSGPLPPEVVAGSDVLRVIGAIAGGERDRQTR